MLDGDQALARADDLVAVYREVFTGPPWNETEGAVTAFRKRLNTDTRRPGFVAALATSGPDEVPSGFCTAWRTAAPFPTERRYSAVTAALGPDAVRERLVGALEIDELGVSPHARGQGLAGRLLDLVCAGEPRCWLLTWTIAPDAVRLYERLGWQRLNEGQDIVIFSKT